MSDELAAALAFDAGLYLRAAQEVIPLRRGRALRARDLPDVHFLNAVTVFGRLPDAFGAPEAVALADQGLAGLRHRLVVLDDVDAAQRIEPELTRRGWERRRTLFMALSTAPERALRDPRARELSDEELCGIQLACFEEENHGPHAAPGLAQRLVQAQARLRAAGTARGFGAGQAGELHSMCTLFLDPDVGGHRMAMVEQVATLGGRREQGLAKAVVSAAIRAGGEWGADLITVPTDADDWPQLLYAGLGFAPLGHLWAFLLHDRGLGRSEAPAVRWPGSSG